MTTKQYNNGFIEGYFHEVCHSFRGINLVVTSPPYYNYRDYGNNQLWETPRAWMQWCIDSLALLSDCIADSGVIWWNTATGYENHRQLTEVFAIPHLVSLNGLYLVDTIPWVKTSGPPKMFKNRPYPMVEYNFVFARNPELVTFYRDNVRRPYAKTTLSRMKYPVSNLTGDKDGEFLDRKKVEPNERGATPPNYLLMPQDTTGRPHPAAMLPALANWAIRAYSKEGDTILDPFCGIGTTCVEAHRLNRNFIGVDCNWNYLQIAVRSIERLRAGLNPYTELDQGVKLNDS